MTAHTTQIDQPNMTGRICDLIFYTKSKIVGFLHYDFILPNFKITLPSFYHAPGTQIYGFNFFQPNARMLHTPPHSFSNLCV